jgi:hypothetical protein
MCAATATHARLNLLTGSNREPVLVGVGLARILSHNDGTHGYGDLT